MAGAAGARHQGERQGGALHPPEVRALPLLLLLFLLLLRRLRSRGCILAACLGFVLLAAASWLAVSCWHAVSCVGLL